MKPFFSKISGILKRTRNFFLKKYVNLRAGVQEVVDEHTDYLPYKPDQFKPGETFPRFFSREFFEEVITPTIQAWIKIKKYNNFKPALHHLHIMDLEDLEREEKLKEEAKRKEEEVEREVKENVTSQKVENVKKSKNRFDDVDFSKLLKERVDLMRSAFRQFIIGYNEGMGREFKETPKTEMNFSLSDDKWKEVVRKIAEKSREFTEEMKKTVDVKDEDLKK